MIHEASDGRSCNHRSIVLEPAQCATDALANGIGVGPFKVREENRDRRRIGSLRVDEVPHALDVAADFAELSPQRRLGFPEFRMTPPEFRVAPSARGDDLGVGLELGLNSAAVFRYFLSFIASASRRSAYVFMRIKRFESEGRMLASRVCETSKARKP